MDLANKILISYPPDIMCRADNPELVFSSNEDAKLLESLRAINFQLNERPYSVYRLAKVCT